MRQRRVKNLIWWRKVNIASLRHRGLALGLVKMPLGTKETGFGWRRRSEQELQERK